MIKSCYTGSRPLPRCIQKANTLVQDLPQCIEEIAKHMGIPLDPELKAIAAEQASLRCMLQHASKYDEHMLKINRNSICGLPPAAGLSDNQASPPFLSGIVAPCYPLFTCIPAQHSGRFFPALGIICVAACH